LPYSKENLDIEMASSVYTVLGLMSGTSLDGADIAICNFSENARGWQYKFLYTRTFPYDSVWYKNLKNAPFLNGRELIELDRAFGDYLSQIINTAIAESKISPEIIASHGHTVFHTPQNRLTLQIGHGANISAGTRLPVVCDFRSIDVALGGQGAPLVPFGDKILFSDYDSCLNIGGFANISFDLKGIRKAFDICPVNIVLNDFAVKYGKDYDADGILGRKGHVDSELLSQLNNLNYYKTELPKSLGREWIDDIFVPILNSSAANTHDKFRTLYAHFAYQIVKVFDMYNIKKVLVTGGGTYNKFLLENISSLCKTSLIIPDPLTIEFKEALIFAFLGLMRYRNSVNTLCSVTGAERNSTGGAMYMP
jgi:anhydro-N-acetylmuramic acid kinase